MTNITNVVCYILNLVCFAYLVYVVGQHHEAIILIAEAVEMNLRDQPANTFEELAWRARWEAYWLLK